MATANLALHCGAREVSVEELRQIPCPEAEGRWRPVPHGTVLDYATTALTSAGYEVQSQRLGLSRENARFFGTLILRSPVSIGVSLAVGIRSSIDKSISLQWCCGHRVFVCDNMAFSSSKVIARKHTTNGVLRYQEAICQAVGELEQYREIESQRIKRMIHTHMTNEQAESFLLKAYMDEKILSPQTLPLALKEWREPSFDYAGEPYSAWYLFNAVTYALSERLKTNPQAHAAATIRLGGLLEVQNDLERASHPTTAI